MNIDFSKPKMRCIKAAAQELNISEYALRRWVKQGLVPAVYSGKKALLNLDSVIAFLGGDKNDNV